MRCGEIHVVDYGAENIGSVLNMIRKVGCHILFASLNLKLPKMLYFFKCEITCD